MKKHRLPAEKRSDWTFEPNSKGTWTWRVTHQDGRHEESACAFSTQKECIADATRRGYVSWIPEAERREPESPDSPRSN